MPFDSFSQYGTGYFSQKYGVSSAASAAKAAESSATAGLRAIKALSDSKVGSSPDTGSVISSVTDAKTGSNSVGELPSEIIGALNKLQASVSSNSQALANAYNNQNKLAMEFNASEAAKNREWQQMMSNTAHQREIADLKAAGLNPVLSATGGNGAAVTSGATAGAISSGSAGFDVDPSLSTGLAGLLGTIISSNASMHNANVSAAATLGAANASASASRYSSDNSYSASKHATDMNYDIQKQILDYDYSKLGIDNFTKILGAIIPG